MHSSIAMSILLGQKGLKIGLDLLSPLLQNVPPRQICPRQHVETDFNDNSSIGQLPMSGNTTRGFKISRTLPFQIKGFVCTRKRRVCQKSSKLCTYLRSSRMLSNCTLANRNASRFHLYITCCVCPPTSYASDILCLHFAFQFLMYRNGHGGRPRHFQ
jgi:hypothetical protein